jgi:hypothetical protein
VAAAEEDTVNNPSIVASFKLPDYWLTWDLLLDWIPARENQNGSPLAVVLRSVAARRPDQQRDVRHGHRVDDRATAPRLRCPGREPADHDCSAGRDIAGHAAHGSRSPGMQGGHGDTPDRQTRGSSPSSRSGPD